MFEAWIENSATLLPIAVTVTVTVTVAIAVAFAERRKV